MENRSRLYKCGGLREFLISPGDWVATPCLPLMSDPVYGSCYQVESCTDAGVVVKYNLGSVSEPDLKLINPTDILNVLREVRCA